MICLITSSIVHNNVQTSKGPTFRWAISTYKTAKADGPMGFWGYNSNPTGITALNPCTDSESTLATNANQVRTQNLTVPKGFPPVFRLP